MVSIKVRYPIKETETIDLVLMSLRIAPFLSESEYERLCLLRLSKHTWAFASVLPVALSMMTRLDWEYNSLILKIPTIIKLNKILFHMPVIQYCPLILPDALPSVPVNVIL